MTYIWNSKLDTEDEKSIELDDIIFEEEDPKDFSSKFINHVFKDILS